MIGFPFIPRSGAAENGTMDLFETRAWKARAASYLATFGCAEIVPFAYCTRSASPGA
jgi:hypothetical protein